MNRLKAGHLFKRRGQVDDFGQQKTA